jgi:hypothetical protein
MLLVKMNINVPISVALPLSRNEHMSTLMWHGRIGQHKMSSIFIAVVHGS